MIEVHDRLRPKSFAKFLPDHQFSRFFQQHGQQLEWLFLQPDPFAKLREFTGSKVGFENPKLETPERLYGLLHGKPDRSEICRLAEWPTGTKHSPPCRGSLHVSHLFYYAFQGTPFSGR